MFDDEISIKDQIFKFINKFIAKSNKLDKNNKPKKKSGKHSKSNSKVLVLIGDEENDT